VGSLAGAAGAGSLEGAWAAAASPEPITPRRAADRQRLPHREILAVILLSGEQTNPIEDLGEGSLACEQELEVHRLLR
jgi:hypothetical protein